MKLLLTGFEPFSDIKINPSQVIVAKSMQNGRLAFPAGEITSAILPTAYAAAETRIVTLIDTLAPTVILCLGVDHSATELKLEQVARNCDDASIADNAGDLRSGRLIVPDGPATYVSAFPWPEIREALVRIGLPVSMSDNAGTYVCNHLYYQALHYIAAQNLNIICGFMHIPLLRDLEGGEAAQGSLQSEDVLKALEQIIGVVSHHLTAR